MLVGLTPWFFSPHLQDSRAKRGFDRILSESEVLKASALVLDWIMATSSMTTIDSAAGKAAIEEARLEVGTRAVTDFPSNALFLPSKPTLHRLRLVGQADFASLAPFAA